MSCNFLEVLPLEIRHEVYKHALQSFTGFVALDRRRSLDAEIRFTIVPFDPNQNTSFPSHRLTLFLLRINKQIHRESKNLFWQLNALYLRVTDYLAEVLILESLRDQLSRNIQHMVIDFGIFFLTGTGNAERALRAFADWSRRGRLQKFTVIFPEAVGSAFLYIAPGSRGRSNTPIYFSSPRLPRECAKLMTYVGVLEEALDSVEDDKGGFAAHVKKRIIIQTGLKHGTLADKRKWLVENVFSKNSFTSDLHAGFGGELWMDGELCYRNGLRMTNTLQSQRAPSS